MKNLVVRHGAVAALALACAFPGVAGATACMSHMIEWAVAGKSGTMLVGGTFGVAGSDDGGRTWTPRANPQDSGAGEKAVMAGGKVYLAASNGLYRSDDLGRSWQRLGNQHDVAVSDRGRVFACSADRKAVEVMDAAQRWQRLPMLDQRATAWEVNLRADGKSDSVQIESDINGKKTLKKGGGLSMDLSPRAPSCERVMAAGRVLAVFSPDAIFVSKDEGRSWQGVETDKVLKATPSAEFREAGMQVDERGGLFIDRYLGQQRIVMHSLDGGATWLATPGTQDMTIVGTDREGIYLAPAPNSGSWAPSAVYRHAGGSRPEKLLSLPEHISRPGIRTFFQPGRNTPALVTLPNQLMVLDTDGAWRAIQGTELTKESWTSCNLAPW